MTSTRCLECFFAFLIVNTSLLMIYKTLGGQKKHQAAAILLAVIYVPVFYLFTYSDTIIAAYLSETLQRILRTILVLVLFFVYLCLFKISFKRKLQVYGVFLSALFFSEVMMMAIYTVSDVVTIVWELDFLTRLTYLIINYILNAAACFAACLVLKKTRTNYISVLCLILLLCCCFMCTLITASSFSKPAILLCAAISVFSIFGIYKLSTQLEEKERLKQQFYWLKQLQKTESQYINELQDKSRELSKIRHDFNEQLLSIGLLIKQSTPEALEEAEQIIANVGRSLASVKVCQYTANLLVNTVLDTKVNEAQQVGVTVCPSVNLPPKIDRIEAADLNSLLINLLNNAITACTDLPDNADKTVQIQTAIKNNFLIIKTTNPFKEVRNDNKGKLLTTKPNKTEHGLGLQIIEDIVKKYNGESKIELQEEQFIHTVFLNLQQNPKNK